MRESRRIKTELVMARLTAVKTLAGFDFPFQPSLDHNRVLTLAQLEFIDRNEVLHVLGPSTRNRFFCQKAGGLLA